MRRSAAPLLLLLAAACSPLKAFNGLVPKDPEAEIVARDQPFGAGPRGRLDLYAPRDKPAQPLPVIMFFYGGSWNSGTKDGYAFAGRALAARGFIVAIPDYRLVPEIRFPAFLEDGAAAVRWVRANVARYGGDPDRIVLAGHSAGAYNAAMLSLDPTWLGADRAAVRGFVGLAGPYDFLPFDKPASKAAFAGVADPQTTQPVRFADKGDPPALLLVAGKDDLVSPHNAPNLAAAMKGAGASADVRTYQKLGHIGILTALSRPFRGKAPVLQDMTEFAREVTAAKAPTMAPAA